MSKTLALAVVMMIGCAGDDPWIGEAQWSGSPSGGIPSSLFVHAYSEPSGGAWVVKTLSYDEAIRCSDAREVGSAGLTVTTTDAALAAPGAVPITGTALDPAVPAASLILGGDQYTSGTLTLTELEGTIRATFTAMFQQTTVTGGFDATRCP